MFDDFRKRMNNCSSKMSEISLLRGHTVEVDNEAKNRTEFFEQIDTFFSIINSIHIAKNFHDCSMITQNLESLKEIWTIILEIYSSERVSKNNNLKKMITKLNYNLQLEWENYISSHDAEILDMLDIFSQVCNNKREINEITNSIRSMNSWPLSEVVFNKYENRRTLGEKKISEIHFDKEIEEFLRKVKNQKASLIDLTPEILKWIKENDFDKNIMLSIKFTQ